TEVDQGVDVAVGNGVDTAAAPAIAAIRPAFGNEFFAAKARRAIAAFAGNDFDGCFVYEFHDVALKKKRVRPGRNIVCVIYESKPCQAGRDGCRDSAAT